jgi:hypothetical protein
VNVNDTLAAPFSITAGVGGATLAPNGSEQVTVSFTPTIAGKFTQSFTISSTDPKHPSLTIKVISTGEPGHLDVGRGVGFPKTAVGTPESKTLNVKNSGKGVLHGNVGAISGSGDFSILAGGGAFTLNPGASDSVKLQFDPSAAAKESAMLMVTSDDPHHASVSVKLTGRGK